MRQPEAQEDYEFLHKLGIEFGHSSSHMNLFGGVEGGALCSCDNDEDEIK